jgi:hypothetical protein
MLQHLVADSYETGNRQQATGTWTARQHMDTEQHATVLTREVKTKELKQQLKEWK